MSTVPNAANPRQRMIEEMQLRRFSERRIESYLRAVSQLAGFCWKSPDLVRDEALRDYFLYLRNPKRLARAPATIALCGIKFFFTAVLKRDWTTMAIPRPRAEHKRPVVLSVAETWRILDAVRELRHRACLARYIYRVALADTALIAADADTVTFRYRDAVTRKKKKLTLPAAEFIRRFLQHVLPSGFVKVRYYGLHHPSQRQALALARAALGWQQGRPLPPPEPEPAPRQITCPDCETVMLCVAVLMPGRGATHARAPPNPAGRSG